MLRIYADKFVFVMRALSVLQRELDRRPRDTLLSLDPDRDLGLGQGLRGLVGIFTELEMPVSKRDAEALMNMYERREERPVADVSAVISTLCASVETEFEGRLVIATGMSGARLFKPKEPLFGNEVEAKFSQISEDISEAGKCLALGRYTASVFHLMRTLEATLKVLGDKLGVTVIDKHNSDLEWGIILANIKVAVDKIPKSVEKTNWSSVASLLTHVKIAWRNRTMHPKQTYTEEEAKEIFAASRAFMRSLTSLV